MGLRVTSVWTVGRYWRLHPLPQPPPSHPLCAFLSFIFSLEPGAAYRAFSTSYPYPPPPQPHPALSLKLLPQTHTLTYEHTHSFNLLLRLPSPPPPPPSTPFHILVFPSLSLHPRRQPAGRDPSYRCSDVGPDT